MQKIKDWVMTFIVKKFLAGMVGKAIAKGEGKRTQLGIAVAGLLALAKYLLPIFVPAIDPAIMEGIDYLLASVLGATGSFAGVKLQNIWKGLKQAGDEVIK